MLGWKPKNVPRIESILRMPIANADSLPASQFTGQSPIKADVLDRAYDEFCRRVETGEDVDIVAFCKSHERYQTELRRRIELHRFFDENPETLDLLEPIPWPVDGDELGPGTILEELGRGGVGRVYLAQDNSLPRKYVIKASAFENGEAHRLSKLNHPNVVPIHFVDEDEFTELNLIVMPFQSRHTLHDVLDTAFGGDAPAKLWSTVKDQLFSKDADFGHDTVSTKSDKTSYREKVLQIGAELAEALQHCHDQDVYHFDLKPSNILLLPDGKPMLIDFGVGTDADHGELVGGTKPYMSPEQIRKFLFDHVGDGPNEKSDVYSLGVILCQMLTGDHPFSDVAFSGTEEQLLLRQQSWTADGLGAHGLSAQLVATLNECLAPEPSARPNAGDLAKSLLKAAGERSRKIKRRSFVAALAGGALAAGYFNPDVAFATGLMHRENREWEPALAAFDRAIGRDSKNPKYLTARASVFLMRSWEVLDWDPVFGTVPSIRKAKEDVKLAHADYLSATSSITNPVLTSCLAYTHYRLGQYSEARTSALEARRSGFENSQIANIEGLARTRDGRGIANLCLAAKRYPGDQTAQLNVVRSQMKAAREGDLAAIRSGLQHIRWAFEIGPTKIYMHQYYSFFLACEMIHGKVANVNERKREICSALVEGLKARLHPPHAILGSSYRHVFEPVLNDVELKRQMTLSAGVEARRSVRIDHPLGVIGDHKWVPYLDV